jgi:hypothetical protein
VLNNKLTTSERCEEVELHFANEIVLLALEPVMRLLLYNDDHISWFGTWCLITLAGEGNSLAVLHALVYVNLQVFLLRDCLLSLASAAPIASVDDFSGPRAFVTGGLHLLNHWTHLTQSDANTTSVAGMTGLDGAFLAALSFALGADNVASEGELGDLSLIKVLEGDVDSMYKVFSSSGALAASSTWATTATKETSSAAAKELAEQILETGSVTRCFGRLGLATHMRIHSTTETALLGETSLSPLVIDSSLVGIGENFVSESDLSAIGSG